MTKRMLIDATHPEETRVSVVDGRRLEEFDVEVASRKQLKGNIYLAKITRVEPSLQAAFVEYGGNRHGFLAFSEIHPDYYRIPIEDREALLAEQAAMAREEDDDQEDDSEGGLESEASATIEADSQPAMKFEADGAEPEDAAGEPSSEFDAAQSEAPSPGDRGGEAIPLRVADEPDLSLRGEILEPETGEEPAQGETSPDTLTAEAPTEPAAGADEDEDASGHDALTSEAAEPGPALAGADEAPQMRAVIEQAPAAPQSLETVGGDEAEESTTRRPRPMSRRYKIQDVIKRRQIILVQVTKEERGNKGAALTTYLSLAGRYCVLMPNTDRGGGVSRKITNAGDRKRLKSIIDDLELPPGMAVIVRTAGSDRSKPEVKRDFEYLLRLWDEIRELTLHSTAPALIYEEANLIKRAIRDLYSRDIEDIQVEGDEAYKAAKSFMRMLTPSHAKRVQQYRDPAMPLFTRYQIESQLDAIHNPVVQLKSGGYIVINQTEALVAIDVNSGRATRERNIEETALKTNLEAADEIARQLRLRDLAGLVVIDFIDMDEQRHNGQVERRLKEALRHDRARIQLGRISPFGLLEMSRQRMRPSLVEASTETCRYCRGAGRVRSTESTALHVLRSIEEEGAKQKTAAMTVHVPPAVALFILNQKRRSLADLEARQGLRIYLAADEALVPPDFRIERMKALAPGDVRPAPVVHAAQPVEEPEPEAEAEVEAVEAEEPIEEPATQTASEDRGPRAEGGGERRRGRRRRRRGRERHGGDTQRPQTGERHAERHAPERHPSEGPQPTVQASGSEGQESLSQDEGRANDQPGDITGPDGEQRRRRRRGRRGGRRRRRGGERGPEGMAGQSPDNFSPSRDGYENEGPEPLTPASFTPVGSPSPAAAEEHTETPEHVTGRHESAPQEQRESAPFIGTGHASSSPIGGRAPGEAEEHEGHTESPSHVAGRHEVPPHDRYQQPAEGGAAPAAPGSEAETSQTGPRKKGWWQRMLPS